jgi:ADP-heptose:LPS heptosyltransferase
MNRAHEFIHHHLGEEDRLVLLHPGSGGPNKLWSPAGWLSIIHRTATYQQIRLGLVQGPADFRIVQQLSSQLETESYLLLDNWRLGELAALIGHAELYLGNDSGITHLAAACGTATIALFGPTEPSIWAPKGPQVQVICWQFNSPGSGLRVVAEERSEPPPETELVWEKARRWLRL